MQERALVAGAGPVGLVAAAHLARSNTLRTKQLELLHEVVPNASMIGMLVNSKIPTSKDHIGEQQTAASALGLNMQIVEATSEGDLAPAFASLAANRAGALYVDGDSLFTGLRAQLAALATQHAMPTIFNERDSVIAGGLMSYGASMTDAYRQAGIYAGRIFKGERPSENWSVPMSVIIGGNFLTRSVV